MGGRVKDFRCLESCHVKSENYLQESKAKDVAKRPFPRRVIQKESGDTKQDWEKHPKGILEISETNQDDLKGKISKKVTEVRTLVLAAQGHLGL